MINSEYEKNSVASTTVESYSQIQGINVRSNCVCLVKQMNSEKKRKRSGNILPLLSFMISCPCVPSRVFWKNDRKSPMISLNNGAVVSSAVCSLLVRYCLRSAGCKEAPEAVAFNFDSSSA